MTLHQSIANVTREAGTQRGVIPHFTLSVPAAGSNARVVTVVVSACLSQRTVAVNDTLWLALSVRVSEQSRRTGALAVVSHLPWNGPGAARVGITGISYDWCWF